MPILVRSGEGSLQFKTRTELKRAVQSGLVEAGDTVQFEADGPWQEVREVSGLQRRRRGFSHWYVLAAILVFEAVVLRAGLLIIGGTVMMHTMYVRFVRRERVRWW